jgi:hypothetical protein
LKKTFRKSNSFEMSRSTLKVSTVKPGSTKAVKCHTCTLPKHQSHSEVDGVAKADPLSASASMFALQPPAAAYDPRKYDAHCPVLSSTEHESLSDLLDGTAKKGEKRHFALPTFDVSPVHFDFIFSFIKLVCTSPHLY